MIFVVDDDNRIRAATASALRAMGHDVLDFDSGATALAAIAKGDQPDILVTDVLMPGLKGTALARAAKQSIPGLRVLFMSGDVGDTQVEEFDGHDLLTKPFTLSSLAAALGQLIPR
jgi:CheY-like chemotaxis protein